MEVIGDQALTVNLVFGTLVFAAAAKIYLLPKLNDWRPQAVLVPILLLHSQRHLGLMFLASGAVYSGMLRELPGRQRSVILSRLCWHFWRFHSPFVISSPPRRCSGYSAFSVFWTWSSRSYWPTFSRRAFRWALPIGSLPSGFLPCS